MRRGGRSSGRRRRLPLVVPAAAALAALAAPLAPAGAAPGTAPPTPLASIHLAWTVALGAPTTPFAESSPTVATFPAGRAVVVGNRDARDPRTTPTVDTGGKVYAFSLATGAPEPGWPVTVGAPVDSTPSVLPSPTPTGPDVFVGSGNAAFPDLVHGGYRGLTAGGSVAWYEAVVNPPSDTQPATGVQASMALGTLGGSPGVVAGSLGQEAYALGAATGTPLSGWPFFTSDSTFSTPALADLYGTGRQEIVTGGDQTAGYALGRRYAQGGHLRILTAAGDLVCQADPSQTVDSSPAIGRFLAGGTVGIVTGTGAFWPGAPDTDKVLAFTPTCAPAWATTVGGDTTSSPALVTLTGQLDVAEGTHYATLTTPGTVVVLDGATGAVLWKASTTTGGVLGSVTTADLTGDGHQDLLVPTPAGLDVYAPDLSDPAASAKPVLVLDDGTAQSGGAILGFQSSALVTAGPGPTAAITVAGYGGASEGYVQHWVVTLPPGAPTPAGPGSWPEFHHDPQLTGDAGTAGAPAAAPCAVPPPVAGGYTLVASDGTTAAFATAGCGSPSGHHLNAPIVGAAAAPVTGGYWLVAADGGVFAYGGAQFYGSMGGSPLNQPIVGMAATPDGRGYWLVAADGGVFTFGDAAFYGSTGSLHLNAPIVGIAGTADGLGYRLVAADGGVFTFGPSAQFFGSMGGTHLNRPVVGIADDPVTGGYWLVAADGGVFSFGAPFWGSAGSLELAKPIVAILATGNGAGYRFAAADGGVFDYGAARYAGSLGGDPPAAPVVAIA